MKTKIIVAYDEKRCIGNQGAIPWHIKEDFLHFKRTTLDSTIIMGRKTWESLPKKPLPKRKNIVVTRQVDYEADAIIFNDLKLALEANPDSYLIGGSEIYKQGIELGVSTIIASEVDGVHEGDAFFPELVGDWKKRVLKEYEKFKVVEWRR